MPEFFTIHGGMRFRASRPVMFRDGIEIHLWSEHGPNAREISAAQPIVFKTLSEEELNQSHEPCLRCRVDAAQQLMDELWHCGLRPSEGTGSAGALAATQAHLKDMQAIAMNRLGITK